MTKIRVKTFTSNKNITKDFLRRHPFSGSHGVIGSAGPSQVGVSALGYPSGQADPPDSSMHSGGQMSTSLATGIIVAEVHA